MYIKKKQYFCRMKTYKAIFLDWDDTIGDWGQAEHKALTELYERFGLERLYPSAEAFINAYQPYNLRLWERYGRGEISKEYLHRERFLHTLGEDGSFLPEAADAMGDKFLQLTNKYFSVLPHAAEVVRYLAGKYPLTIISNGFKEVQYYKFAHSGLADCFAYTLISEEVGVNKPQPEIFEKALALNGVREDEALMIGDSLTSDMAGAHNAGIDSLWINNKGQSTKLQGEEPTYTVTDIREVMQIL